MTHKIMLVYVLAAYIATQCTFAIPRFISNPIPISQIFQSSSDDSHVAKYAIDDDDDTCKTYSKTNNNDTTSYSWIILDLVDIIEIEGIMLQLSNCCITPSIRFTIFVSSNISQGIHALDYHTEIENKIHFIKVKAKENNVSSKNDGTKNNHARFVKITNTLKNTNFAICDIKIYGQTITKSNYSENLELHNIDSNNTVVETTNDKKCIELNEKKNETLKLYFNQISKLAIIMLYFTERDIGKELQLTLICKKGNTDDQTSQTKKDTIKVNELQFTEITINPPFLTEQCNITLLNTNSHPTTLCETKVFGLVTSVETSRSSVIVLICIIFLWSIVLLLIGILIYGYKKSYTTVPRITLTIPQRQKKSTNYNNAQVISPLGNLHRQISQNNSEKNCNSDSDVRSVPEERQGSARSVFGAAVKYFRRSVLRTINKMWVDPNAEGTQLYAVSSNTVISAYNSNSDDKEFKIKVQQAKPSESAVVPDERNTSIKEPTKLNIVIPPKSPSSTKAVSPHTSSKGISEMSSRQFMYTDISDISRKSLLQTVADSFPFSFLDPSPPLTPQEKLAAMRKASQNTPKNQKITDWITGHEKFIVDGIPILDLALEVAKENISRPEVGNKTFKIDSSTSFKSAKEIK